MFYQLIYVSVAVRPFGPEDLRALGTRARTHNSHRHITGVLFYGEGHFAQVLEGAREEVEALFAAIQRDGRHHHVTVVTRSTRPRREFPHWSMAVRQLTYPAFAELIKCLPDSATARSEPVPEAEPDAVQRSLSARLESFVQHGVRL